MCICLPDFSSLNRAGPAGAPALHPRAFGALAESLPALAGGPHFASGLSGPPQTRSQRGCDSHGEDSPHPWGSPLRGQRFALFKLAPGQFVHARSPGPAAPLGNDFYALTISTNF
jgi:hypothetical protein